MKNFTRKTRLALLALFVSSITFPVNAQDNSLDFDGINDYVEVPFNSATLPTIASVQLSVKITSSVVEQPIFSNGGADINGKYSGFGLFAEGGYWTILYGNGAAAPVALTGPAINLGVWTNIAGSYDGTTLKLYVDGVLVASAVPSPSILPNLTFPLRLGAWPSNPPATFFGGEIDELSMWNNVLTPAKISSNMAGGLNPTQANLIGYYNFNQGIAGGNNQSPIPVNKLKDLTPYANDGTLNNFALNGPTSNWVTNTVVPVTLTSFNGSKKDGSNLLQWSTASEQNSSYFEIQRGTDGINFNAIGKVDAAGNSNDAKNYSYSDDQLSSLVSVYYYRLKLADNDGKTKYSSIIHIKNSNNAVAARIFPNPVNDQFTISIDDNKLLNTRASLNDIKGKLLQKINISQASTKVNISNYLKGVYILKFQNGSSIKIIKE